MKTLRKAARPLRAAVFLNGEYADDRAFYQQLTRSVDLVVAADGGAGKLVGFGEKPHVVVGDFDSLDPEVLASLSAQGVRVVRHPVRKNETDAELAVAEALAAGATSIAIAGALGGSFDHAWGNVAVLRSLAQRGVEAALVQPDLSVSVAVAPRRVLLSAVPGVRFSCLPLTSRAVVSLRGFDYELDHTALHAEACRGIGNTVARSGAEVVLHSGEALLVVEAVELPGGSAQGPS